MLMLSIRVVTIWACSACALLSKIRISWRIFEKIGNRSRSIFYDLVRLDLCKKKRHRKSHAWAPLRLQRKLKKQLPHCSPPSVGTITSRDPQQDRWNFTRGHAAMFSWPFSLKIANVWRGRMHFIRALKGLSHKILGPVFGLYGCIYT